MPGARRKAPERKAPGDYHHGNLRRALLDAAGQILAEHPAEPLTMREAARRVGVDHRAAYRHFADRDALLAAVAEEGHADLAAAMAAGLASGGATARARLLALARAYVRFAHREPGRYQVMMGPRERSRFLATDAAVDRAFAVIQDEIARGIAAGELAAADALVPAAALWSSMHGVAHLSIARRLWFRRERLDELTDRLIGHVLDGLLAR